MVLHDLTRSYSCRHVLARTASTPFRRHHTVVQSITRLNFVSASRRTLVRPDARTYTTFQAANIVYSDPNRSDLFYHLMYAPSASSQEQPIFALSFLEVAPPDLDSPAVIGWLPAQTYLTDVPQTPEEQTRSQEPTLEDFVPNPKFVEALQDTVRHVLKEGLDEIWENGAKQIQAGWMHINDQRNIPALGRVGDPDDIIGSVLVEDSKIKAETYQPMPSYRLCTSDGILQLTPGLAKHLRENLLQQTKESAGAASAKDSEEETKIKRDQ
ncbi:hypothetical protein CPB84DRAFT_1681168 [Gymnopilus junonius]|uniref:Uncharacterized protein n=1 Tax=Gymnopilus junonius TaxID=109634 RepID=A0A9P5TMV9_GYMJU|nr:hypothetical protein CPB84DRAFT_1681168 [Gymnopilus junonius]